MAQQRLCPQMGLRQREVSSKMAQSWAWWRNVTCGKQSAGMRQHRHASLSGHRGLTVSEHALADIGRAT